jgi:hypothetical protein
MSLTIESACARCTMSSGTMAPDVLGILTHITPDDCIAAVEADRQHWQQRVAAVERELSHSDAIHDALNNEMSLCSQCTSEYEHTVSMAVERWEAENPESAAALAAAAPAATQQMTTEENTMSNETPRRAQLQQWTPAEHAIRNAMFAVEATGAHPLLTDAVVLLGEAKDKVAEFVDLTPGGARDGE